MTDKYPYCGAKNGMPGKPTCDNNKVPAVVSFKNSSPRQ
jgi:hypothetical protein